MNTMLIAVALVALGLAFGCVYFVAYKNLGWLGQKSRRHYCKVWYKESAEGPVTLYFDLNDNSRAVIQDFIDWSKDKTRGHTYYLGTAESGLLVERHNLRFNIYVE